MDSFETDIFHTATRDTEKNRGSLLCESETLALAGVGSFI